MCNGLWGTVKLQTFDQTWRNDNQQHIMALVDYSDSESESETPKQASTAFKLQAAKAQSTSGKIQVNLPAIRPEPGQADTTEDHEPPTKRAKTGGAFSGFNSFLPAPKRTNQNAPKKGVSLKTSSEAAFSRNAQAPTYGEDESYDEFGVSNANNADIPNKEHEKSTAAEEPKLVGKATRFLPLSVSNKKKKKPVAKPPPDVEERKKSRDDGRHLGLAKAVTQSVARKAESIPKPKRSLFSVEAEEDVPATPATPGEYEPLVSEGGRAYLPDEMEQLPSAEEQISSNATSLEAVAADMNLTAAQRRQLFGRNGGKNANVMHFNMDSEYASNEQMRQAGEVVEHRAVKAIAPGKHSLQQLVNNARTQQDSLEDKWAEGRRNKGEGGSKYGWST